MKYTLAELKKASPKDWYVYYSYRDPETGFLTPFKVRDGINRIKDLSEKRAYGADLVAKKNKQLREGWSPFVSTSSSPEEFRDMTLIQVIDKMLEIKASELRSDTNRSYKSGRDILAEYLKINGIDGIKPKYFTSMNAQSFSDYLIIEKKNKAKTHNNVLSFLSPVFTLLKGRKIIDENPFTGIPRKKETEKRVLFYNDEDKKRIKDHLKKTANPLYYFVQFEFYCFIRPKELCLIQAKHIDFVNQALIVPGDISKNTKNGSVPIHTDLFKIINEKYRDLDPEIYLFSRGLVPGFISIHRDVATKAHRSMLIDLGIDTIHKLYEWKHTGARLFIISGRSVVDLMIYMRHSSLDETLHYLMSLGVNVEKNKTDPKAWTF